MTKKPTKTNEITNLRMNNLRGRMLRIESKTKSKARKEILIIYDIGMNLELVSALAKKLSTSGCVTAVDLPGTGGMDSFYTIKTKPTLENYAAYLASFIKLRYNRKKLSIIAIGTGATIVTKMLQQYPLLATKVTGVVLLDGALDNSDVKTKNLLATRFALNLMLLSPLSLIGRLLQVAKPGQDLRSELYMRRSLLLLKIDSSRISIPVHAAIVAKKDIETKIWKEHYKVVFKNLSTSIVRKKMLPYASSIFDELPVQAKKIIKQ